MAADISPVPASRQPLLVCAELPEDVLAWADGLRRAHYPLERNRLRAHVTLFHGLPPSASDAVDAVLARLGAGHAPPEARIAGLMDIGNGTALAVDCAAMVALHEEIAEALHGLVQQRDARPLRLHITVQAKVSRAEAEALQAELRPHIPSRAFRFRGFGIYRWDGALWNFAKLHPFRGRDRKQRGVRET